MNGYRRMASKGDDPSDEELMGGLAQGTEDGGSKADADSGSSGSGDIGSSNCLRWLRQRYLRP